MVAPEVLNLPLEISALIANLAILGLAVTGAVMLSNKYGFPLPVIGRKHISLLNACQKIYSLSQKLKQKDPQWGLVNALDGEVTGGDDLRYYHLACNYVWENNNMLFGKRTKSDFLEPITIDDIGGMGNLEEDCKTITYTLGRVMYEDLHVSSRELRRYLRDMRKS